MRHKRFSLKVAKWEHLYHISWKKDKLKGNMLYGKVSFSALNAPKREKHNSIKSTGLDFSSILNPRWWSSNICSCMCVSIQWGHRMWQRAVETTVHCGDTLSTRISTTVPRGGPVTILPLTTCSEGGNKATMATPAHIWRLCSHPVTVFMGQEMMAGHFYDGWVQNAGKL